MLSLGKLAPGQQQYYLDTVAKGAEEYYTGAKETPGQWVGRSTERLGLTGEVDPDALGDVLSGRDPRVGVPLTRAQGAPRRPGLATKSFRSRSHTVSLPPGLCSARRFALRFRVPAT